MSESLKDIPVRHFHQLGGTGDASNPHRIVCWPLRCIDTAYALEPCGWRSEPCVSEADYAKAHAAHEQHVADVTRAWHEEAARDMLHA